ncbi:MAG: SDR family NAD(P)-dependent oxidoreductase [Betaproteobacteria bacterium]
MGSLSIAITGASAGIGRATALRLARDGARVALCARRADRLERLADEVRQAGGQALTLVADVTSEHDMQRFVAETVERFGGLDVMMCNAGFGMVGAIDDIAPADVRRIMDVNYFGTVYAAQAALPVFRRQQRGHLIVVSSIVGRRGVPYMGAYAATKFAQAGLVECLRAECVGTGLHVTSVFPISTETEFFDVMQRESGAPARARGPRQRADAVADAIARAIAHPVPEVYPYAKSRGLVLLNALAPGLCDRFVRKFGRQPIPPDAATSS